MERSKSTFPFSSRDTRDQRRGRSRTKREVAWHGDGKENAETQERNVGDDEVVVYTLYRMHEIFGSRESPLLRHREDTIRVSVEAYILYGYG